MSVIKELRFEFKFSEQDELFLQNLAIELSQLSYSDKEPLEILRLRFINHPSISSLPKKKQGHLWGALRKEFTQKPKPKSINFNQLPLPIYHVLQELEAENQPLRQLNRLIDLIETFIKFHSVIGIGFFSSLLSTNQSYSEKEREQLHAIKMAMVEVLSSPSLGSWWALTQKTFALSKYFENDTIKNLHVHIKKNLNQVFGTKDNFITLRNDLAHGATPKNEVCNELLKKYNPRLLELLTSSIHLDNLQIYLVKNAQFYQFNTQGLTVLKEAIPPESQNGDCFILLQKGKFLKLSPLLFFEEKDESFYFYNNFRSNDINFLSYQNASHCTNTEQQQHFIQLFPLERWQKDQWRNQNPFHLKINQLTEAFRGRQQDIRQILEFINTNHHGFLVIWGKPGIGKSALLARVIQLVRMKPELRQYELNKHHQPKHDLLILEYFLEKQTTPEQFFNSMNLRLDDLFQESSSLGTNIQEKEELFKRRIELYSKNLKQNQKLLIIIDGLDEIEHHSFLYALPYQTTEKILIIFGSRPLPHLKGVFYTRLSREARKQYDIDRLKTADIRAILFDYVNKYALTQKTIEVIEKKSEGFPLYLKLLCNRLQANGITASNALQLPQGLKEIYQENILQIHSKEPRIIDILILLSAAKAQLEQKMLCSLLNLNEYTWVNQLRPFLFTFIQIEITKENNSLIQLFHASLRDFIKEEYPQDIQKISEQLTDFCVEQNQRLSDYQISSYACSYSIKYAVQHLFASYQHAPTTKGNRVNQLNSLIKNTIWREQNYILTGSALNLILDFQLAQRVFQDYAPVQYQQQILKLTSWIYSEPQRLYLKQKQSLFNLKNKATPDILEQITKYCNITQTKRDTLLLIIQIFHKLNLKNIQLSIPLHTIIQNALEHHKDPALELLWKRTVSSLQLQMPEENMKFSR